MKLGARQFSERLSILCVYGFESDDEATGASLSLSFSFTMFDTWSSQTEQMAYN